MSDALRGAAAAPDSHGAHARIQGSRMAQGQGASCLCLWRLGRNRRRFGGGNE